MLVDATFERVIHNELESCTIKDIDISPLNPQSSYGRIRSVLQTKQPRGTGWVVVGYVPAKEGCYD